MTKWRFFGDSHGCLDELESLAIKADESDGPVDIECVVGDFGFYPNAIGVVNNFSFYSSDPLVDVVSDRPVKRMFIRGNHEDHSMLPLDANEPVDLSEVPGWSYIPDGYIDSSIMFIGGAFSIDRAYRSSGPFRYHENEQISAAKESEIFDKLIENISNINTIVTHDCPFSVYPRVIPGGNPIDTPLNTQARFFDHIFDRIKIVGSDHPRITWIFGHHHKSTTFVQDGVKFVCLDTSHIFHTTRFGIGPYFGVIPSPDKSTITIEVP